MLRTGINEYILSRKKDAKATIETKKIITASSIRYLGAKVMTF